MMKDGSWIIGPDDRILITGATGFIGRRVVQSLLERGFRNLRCFARASSDAGQLLALAREHGQTTVEIVKGNLLSRGDCSEAVKGARIIYHLAAGTGQKSFPDAFMNSVVTTRNLLDAVAEHGAVRRFVAVSSFAVYGNLRKPPAGVLNESCPIDDRPELRGEAYCFAKVKQEEFVTSYCGGAGIPYAIVRPGSVYGPGKHFLSDRVGIDTFGIFLHLGGSNTVPLTYVDNCAEAIVLAGLTPGVDGEVFNVVDDDLPSSRKVLREYKKNVRSFRSLYLPHAVSFALCYLWERYAASSQGQLPCAFNRRRWYAYWKRTRYTNDKLKTRLGWTPKVSSAEGLRRFFEACRKDLIHA